MKHRQAIEYLSELGAGSLTPILSAELDAHVEQCDECKDWLATRDLLAGALSTHGSSDDHPEGSLLALCVIRPEEVHEADREELRIHLSRCSTCRRGVELMRAAIMAARPHDEESYRPPERRASGFRARKWLVAAAFGVFVLGGGVLLGGLLLSTSDLTDASVAQDSGSDGRHAARPESLQELSGRDLDGTHVIGSDRTLMVSRLTVKSGADVTFRSGETVAFGDGFRVASGAKIRVDSGPSERPDAGASRPRSETRPRGGMNRRLNEGSEEEGAVTPRIPPE